jgi:hypothetical protein
MRAAVRKHNRHESHGAENDVDRVSIDWQATGLRRGISGAAVGSNE